MITKIIYLYPFNELSETAKERAIKDYCDNNDHYFLSEDLTESLKSLLEEKECVYNDIKLYYSFAYSQGDGLCFVGEVMNKNGEKMIIKHIGRYYHSKSTDIIYYNEEGEEVEENEELKSLYFELCDKLEKEGYSIIEYVPSFDEFEEQSESNNWTYLETGEKEN